MPEPECDPGVLRYRVPVVLLSCLAVFGDPPPALVSARSLLFGSSPRVQEVHTGCTRAAQQLQACASGVHLLCTSCAWRWDGLGQAQNDSLGTTNALPRKISSSFSHPLTCRTVRRKIREPSRGTWNRQSFSLRHAGHHQPGLRRHDGRRRPPKPSLVLLLVPVAIRSRVHRIHDPRRGPREVLTPSHDSRHALPAVGRTHPPKTNRPAHFALHPGFRCSIVRFAIPGAWRSG